MAKTLLAKIGTVKAIISFLLVVTYCVMSIMQLAINDNFVCMLLMIIGFYFGSEHERKDG